MKKFFIKICKILGYEILDQNKIYGCVAIFAGVVIVQLIPTMIKSK